MQSPNQHSARLQSLLRMGLLLAGPFMLGCLFVILAIAVYLSLEQPKRLAMLRPMSETNILTIINPQPRYVSIAVTNVLMVDPPISAYLNGVATNAAIWVNGKSFKSGARGALELFKASWPLWSISFAASICWLRVNRWGRKVRS